MNSSAAKTLLTAIAAVASAVVMALLLAEGQQQRELHTAVRLEAAMAPAQAASHLPRVSPPQAPPAL